MGDGNPSCSAYHGIVFFSPSSRVDLGSQPKYFFASAMSDFVWIFCSPVRKGLSSIFELRPAASDGANS